ncbi:MAG TPA: hypothetical protein VLI90_12145 [Tepidisphaeraceae bacterium]|nr:hypothetical protein [Tepidisphaeraceae bacterium]
MLVQPVAAAAAAGGDAASARATITRAITIAKMMLANRFVMSDLQFGATMFYFG